VTGRDLTVERWQVPNDDGWSLAVRRATLGAPAEGRPPLLIVPGYAMNSFIFSYHPRGRSLERSLAERGFEVWSADLRGQGDSRRAGPARRYGLADLAFTDLRRVLDHVLAHTTTGASRADVIGCSLGATLMLAQAAIGRDTRMGSLVSLGGPMRWERIHPVLRAAFSVPAVAGLVRVRNTRKLARLALPWLVHVPGLLSIYINTSATDVSPATALEMTKTVEDPVPAINREIAEWVRARDLTLRGENLTVALRRLENPVLCVVASADGIVPPETALSPLDHVSSARRDVLTVGGEGVPIAHADLFVGNDAETLVFDPIARWLIDAASGDGAERDASNRRVRPHARVTG